MISLNKIMDNKILFSSEKLCEMIVTAKYLKFDNQIIILCMQELSLRRSSGDNFSFEEKIKEMEKSLPIISNESDLKKIINQAVIIGKI